MPAFQLIPACKDYAWGGHRCLREDYAVKSDLEPLAEAWMLSARPDSPSLIQGGDFGGMSFPDYLAKAGAKALGTLGQKFETFPMLVKLIDAKQGLPVQAYPTEEYAQAHGQASKAKLWVVLDAVPGAYLYCGLEHEVTREELQGHIADGTLSGLLRKVPIKKGVLHPLRHSARPGRGPGRRRVPGEHRRDPLRLRGRFPPGGGGGGPGGRQPAPDGARGRGSPPVPVPRLHRGPLCRHHRRGVRQGLLPRPAGGATLYCDGEHKTLSKGGCFFLPAGCGPYRLEGNCEILAAYLS